MIGGRSLLAAGCTLAALLAGSGGTSSTSHAPPAAHAERGSGGERPPPPPKLAPNPWKEPREAEIRPHPGASVQHVIVRDVGKGTGPAAQPGDTVKLDYIEANWTSGHEFMRAWGGEPWPTADVGLTPDASMRGLIIGMRGMRVGGHRRILVPRALSDVHDADRVGNSYKEIVYYDVVLRAITSRDGKPWSRH